MWPQRPHWQWHLANALPQEKGIDRVVLQLAGTDDVRLDVPGQKSKQRNMSTMKKIRAGARRCLGMAFDRGQWPQTGGAHRKACGCPCAHAPLLSGRGRSADLQVLQAQAASAFGCAKRVAAHTRGRGFRKLSRTRTIIAV